MAGIAFQREPAHEVFEELVPLLISHYREIAIHMGEPLQPDWPEYARQEQFGFLRVFTARDSNISRVNKIGQMVGYAVFFVRQHLHSAGSKQAIADLLYVDPERRGFGAAFIRWCDEQLKAEGVAVVYHSVTPYFDFSSILRRLKYVPVGTSWARRFAE